METAVRLQGVTHVYVTRREASLAVEHITFDIRKGEFVSLVGPSGCGKTTILSIVAGLIQPTRGSVSVNGREIDKPDASVGYMLQQDYLFPWRKIMENVMLGLELTDMVTEENKTRVLQLLEEMGLRGYGQLYPHQLSGGMRQRVALVRTLATDPKILLLDEPFSALDYQTKLQLEDLVVCTLRMRKNTALLVTHDLTEAIAMSDRVIIMGRNPGRIRREIRIPEPIRSAPPLEAREHSGFIDLFHEIWDELESEKG